MRHFVFKLNFIILLLIGMFLNNMATQNFSRFVIDYLLYLVDFKINQFSSLLPQKHDLFELVFAINQIGLTNDSYHIESFM